MQSYETQFKNENDNCFFRNCKVKDANKNSTEFVTVAKSLPHSLRKAHK